jgi:hypothetical protein
MRKIKFRINLKNKTTFEEMEIYPELYDKGTGLINFPIDLNKFEILNIDEWIGEVENYSELMLYENDKLKIQEHYEGDCLVKEYIGTIVFTENTFMVRNDDDLSDFIEIYEAINYGIEKLSKK